MNPTFIKARLWLYLLLWKPSFLVYAFVYNLWFSDFKLYYLTLEKYVFPWLRSASASLSLRICVVPHRPKSLRPSNLNVQCPLNLVYFSYLSVCGSNPWRGGVIYIRIELREYIIYEAKRPFWKRKRWSSYVIPWGWCGGYSGCDDTGITVYRIEYLKWYASASYDHVLRGPLVRYGMLLRSSKLRMLTTHIHISGDTIPWSIPNRIALHPR